jgi:hypothetical protein
MKWDQSKQFLLEIKLIKHLEFHIQMAIYSLHITKLKYSSALWVDVMTFPIWNMFVELQYSCMWPIFESTIENYNMFTILLSYN